MSKKKETSNGKAVINVRKISGKEEWYLVLNLNSATKCVILY